MGDLADHGTPDVGNGGGAVPPRSRAMLEDMFGE
jgi:hypothetical protein